MKSFSVHAAIVLAVTGACITLAPSASGAYTTTVSASGFSSTDGNVNKSPFDVTETDNPNGSKSLVSSGFNQRQTLTSPAVINAFAGGDATAFASGGTLKAKLTTSAYQVDTNLFTPRVTANVGASFVDTVTLTAPSGSSLKTGDPVSYKVRWVLDGVTNSPYYYSGFHYRLGILAASFSVYNGSELKAGTGFNLPPYEGYTINSVFAIDVPYTVSGLVGDSLTVSASLGLGADNRSGSILDGSSTSYGDQSTLLDFSNTMHVYLDPLTNGLSLSAASLHNYASPEPASLAILSLGMITLLNRRQR